MSWILNPWPINDFFHIAMCAAILAIGLHSAVDPRHESKLKYDLIIWPTMAILWPLAILLAVILALVKKHLTR